MILTQEQLAELKRNSDTWVREGKISRPSTRHMLDTLPALIAMAEENECLKLDYGALSSEAQMLAKDNDDLRVENARLREALQDIAPAECPTNDTEYNGRMYTSCNACDATLSEDRPHESDCAWVTARQALESANG